ncbi:MAG: nucleotidyl transferase AbiEii/AbiGii toxin family protein [Blastocatellia bacterium]
MEPDKSYYFDRLYPFQDDVLRAINEVETEFHLTGGTALSRVYLHHRFSDDLDLFVNYDGRFGDWAERIIDACQRRGDWQTKVALKDQYFVRALLEREDLTLKLEMVNDVASRVGAVRAYPTFGRVDSPENILANKLTALIGRAEPRDIADVWGLCTKLGLSINDAISGAQSKSSGIYPLDLARRLCEVTRDDWEAVMWIEAPDWERFQAETQALGESLILPPGLSTSD